MKERFYEGREERGGTEKVTKLKERSESEKGGYKMKEIQ